MPDSTKVGSGSITSAFGASVTFPIETSAASFYETNKADVQRFLDTLKNASPEGSQFTWPPEPSTPVAPWWGTVQRRINASIGAKPEGAINDGTWLSKDAVHSANAFFQISSYLLPGEPHLYASRGGDVVAEFGNNSGRLTLVISKDTVLAFVVVTGNRAQATSIQLAATSAADVRDAIARVTAPLRAKPHGPVEAKT